MNDDEVLDFMYKPEFGKKYGISARTIDAWVKKGRVDRIVDLDGRAMFHLLPEGSPVFTQPPPLWASVLLETLQEDNRRLEAKIDALEALVARLGASEAPAPRAAVPQLGSGRAAVPWWRRLLGLERVW